SMSVLTPAAIPAPMPPPAAPLTLAEFERHHGHRRVEVIDGHIKEKPVPPPRHGRTRLLIGRFLDEVAERTGAGRAVTNDSFVRIAEDPLRILAPDVGYYSYCPGMKEAQSSAAYWTRGCRK
ncbi:MAG: Uma2 family endonuclease, partial [Gemmataceae bacterium]